MMWITRFALALLAALWLGSAALAQSAPATPPPPEVTVGTLRAQLEQMPVGVETEDEVQRLNDLTNRITAQAEGFVASRTTQLADLNARLGELGPPPAAGATEDSDVTRQRATQQKQRNTIDAAIRLARLMAVNAQQRRSEMLAQRRAVFEAQLFERSDSPLSAAFWDKARARWEADRVRLGDLYDDIQQGLATGLRATSFYRAALGTLGGLAIIIVGLWLTESGLAALAARTFPVGRLRRSLLALLTVLGYVFIVGLAASIAWQSVEDAISWSTQSVRLAESMVWFAMFLAFVIGLGRALLANRRSDAMTTNFFGQWLTTKNLLNQRPDAKAYPAFDENLRQAFL